MLPSQQTLSYQFFQYGLTLLLLFFLTCNSSVAQSGRNKTPPPKSSPSSPQPNQPPANEKKEEAAPPKVNQDKAIPILVVYYTSIMMNGGIFSRVVTRGCLERLQQSTLVKPGAGAEMNRKEAYDFAKASKDTYVLWFELEDDIADRESVNNRSFPSIVSYTLYIPETGKTKTSGRIYARQRGSLPTGIPRTNYPGEYLLQLAGQDLADRILDTLNLPKPPRRI